MRSRFLNTLLLPFLTLTSASAFSAAAAAATTATANITFHIPPSHALPNPRALPPQTHAKLTASGFEASALLSPAGTLAFRGVPAGSYLLDVHSPAVAFAPLRVDVLPAVAVAAPAPAAGGEGGGEGEGAARPPPLRVIAWETYRGNDWGNTGEAVAVSEAGSLEVRALGGLNFYAERSRCEFWGPLVLVLFT